jgi:hypothetical protein
MDPLPLTVNIRYLLQGMCQNMSVHLEGIH